MMDHDKAELEAVARLLNEGEHSEALKELRRMHGLVNRWVCILCGHSCDWTMFKCPRCEAQVSARVVVEDVKRKNNKSAPDGNAIISRKIQEEVERAMRLFPEWPTDPVHAAAIVAEECGELQKAVLEAVYEPHKMSRNNVPIEAVQTAAMCIRFLACIDRYSWLEPEERA